MQSTHYWPSTTTPVEVPTLLIRGEKDRTFVPRMETKALAHASDLRVVTIEGVGHWTQFEKPDAANAALSDFVLEEGEVCR